MNILKKEFGNIFKPCHDRDTQIWVPKGVSELDDLVIKLAIRLANLDFIKYVRICDQYFFSLQVVKEIISRAGGSPVILQDQLLVKLPINSRFFSLSSNKKKRLSVGSGFSLNPTGLIPAACLEII
jgi:hypothetical protein